MSHHQIQPGKDSSEHERANRAEVFGVAVAIVGLCAVPLYGAVAAAVAISGVALVGWTVTSYARGRSDIKAAAVRRQPDHPPRI
jgi:cytochrome c biogenesis protein CcdA